MKTSSSTFLAILILISSCISPADKNSNKFVLQGETTGQDSGLIVLSYLSDTTYVIDTVEIKNGKFVFLGKVTEPTRADLNGGNDLNRVMVYLESGKMKINLSKDKYAECRMTGSKTQKDLELITKLEKPYYERLSILSGQYNNISDSIKKSKNSSTKVILEKKAEEIDKLWSKTSKRLDSIQINFVLENPKSFLAGVYLSILEGKETISLDSTKSIFYGLDNSFKKSIYAKSIIEDIRKKENIRIGKQAPDFKAIDLNQQTVTLSQFKGKNEVLLDFWASWCVPCRESIPHLKTIYKNYHSKGLEIIAISIDENKKAWNEAVKQDSTGIWYHIPIAKNWPCRPSKLTNDDIQQNYFYRGVPNQILIDKNGKIIGRFLSASSENQESLDRLLSQVYDN